MRRTQQVERLPGLREVRRSRPLRPDDEASCAAEANPRRPGVGDDEGQVNPSACRDEHLLADDVGRRGHLVPVRRRHPVGHRGPHRGGALVGVHDAHAHRGSGTRAHPGVLRCPVEGVLPPVDVKDCDLVDHRGPSRPGTRSGSGSACRQDHHGAEQPPLDLFVRHLVGVVPVRAGVLRDEPVHEAPADGHGILRHARDTVRRVGDVDAVPVQRRPVGHRLVDEGDLDEVTLVGADRRSGRRAVHRVPLQGSTAGHADPAASRRELDPHVRRACGVGDQRGHVDPADRRARPRCRCTRAPGTAVVARRRRTRRPPVAVDDVAHRHDGVLAEPGRGPREPGDDDQPHPDRREGDPEGVRRGRSSSAHRRWPRRGPATPAGPRRPRGRG